MTEFDKWWEYNVSAYTTSHQNKEFAQSVWDAAQRAFLRTIHDPPYIPNPGEKVRLLGQCHPGSLGAVVEVLGVEKGSIENVYWMENKHKNARGEELYGSGILGEVEPVKEI